MRPGAANMPSSLLHLPRVPLEHITCASESGEFFLEIFAGDCILTLAMTLTHVGVYLPWDSRLGQEFDVTTHGEAILRLARAGALSWVHLGTPCQSMTWARCPQLRTTACPLGRGDLSRRQAWLVAEGNTLAAFSLNLCCCQAKNGGFFSIENPEYSWLWVLPQMIELRRKEGVGAVRLLFSDYHVPFHKPTVFVRNSPFLHMLAEGVLPWRGPKVKLRGLVMFQGRLTFRTHLAQTYPPLLGVKFAALVQQTVLWAQLGGDWRDVSETIRAKSYQFPKAILQADAEIVANCSMDWKFVPHGMGAERGLSPLEHVAFTMEVARPSETCKDLPPLQQEAIDFECKHDVAEIDSFGRSLLEMSATACRLQHEHQTWAQDAPRELQEHAIAIHGPLWKVLLQECGLPHEQFLHDLQFGFPLVGNLPPCEGDRVEQSFQVALTTQELAASRQTINQTVLKAVSDLPFSDEILPQTIDDVDRGFMSFQEPLFPKMCSICPSPGEFLSGRNALRVGVQELLATRLKVWSMLLPFLVTKFVMIL